MRPKRGTDDPKSARGRVANTGTNKPMKVERLVCSSRGKGYVSWLDSWAVAAKTLTRK